MLDAYIIERIQQRRREQQDGTLIPLRIHDVPPPAVPRERDEKREEDPERGSVIIDFAF